MMSRTPHPLRQLQYAAHLSIDEAFSPLAADSEKIVLRHATLDRDGVPRLTRLGVAMAVLDLEAMLVRVEPRVAAPIGAAIVKAGTLG